MKEMVYPYKKTKMYIRFGLMINALIIILLAFLTLKEWSIISITLYILGVVGVVMYIVFKIKKVRQLDYFLKWDTNGVYTQESFTFCKWDAIASITLQRYLGYQTLFFECEETLETNIVPIHKKGKQLYCLPLADCKGNPQEILNQILLAKNSK